jgi:hypothetical protein
MTCTDMFFGGRVLTCTDMFFGGRVLTCKFPNLWLEQCSWFPWRRNVGYTQQDLARQESVNLPAVSIYQTWGHQYSAADATRGY